MPKQRSRRRIGRGSRACALLLALAVLPAACAGPAPYIPVNHQEVSPLPASDVWSRVHAFLQDQNIAVTSENRAAGLIDARKTVTNRGLLAAYADCGRPGLLPLGEESQTLNLTVRITPVADGSQVNAQAAFSRTLRRRHAAALTVACSSTGVIEAAIMQVASGQPMEAAVVPR